MAERVSVTWGPFKLSPLKYQTLDVGPYTVSTDVRPGESTEDAMGRALEAAARFARKAYPDLLESFVDMSRQADAAVRGR